MRRIWKAGDGGLYDFRSLIITYGLRLNYFRFSIMRRTGAVRAGAVVPFTLGPGLEFNVAVWVFIIH